MPTSQEQLGALTRGATIEAKISASFRKRFGVRGADGNYHLPLPPKGHPLAKVFARAVLRRAHQTTKLGADAIARQVSKAKAILGEADTLEAMGLAVRRESGKLGTKWGSLREGQSRFAQPITTFFPLLEGAKIDEEKGTARVVLIRVGPGNSADNHYYTAEALKKAVAEHIFEGAKCYIDHPTPVEEKIIPERSADRLGGFFFDCRFEEVTDLKSGITVEAITAEFQPRVGDERVLSLLRTSEQYAQKVRENTFFGYSINAMGGGEVAEIDGRRFNRVDEITKAFSVDIVTEAGAGGGPIPGSFRESNRMPVAQDLAIGINRAKLLEGMRSPVKAVRSQAFDAFFESQALADLPADIKNKLLEARKAAEKDADLEEDDDVMEAIAEAVEAAVTDEDDKPRQEGKTPAMEERGATPTPDNKHDATAPAGGFHEADIDKMDEAQAKAALKNLNKQYGTKVAEAERLRTDNSASARRLAESQIDALLEDESIPEQFRPRLRRELLAEGALSHRARLDFVHEFAQAYITPNLREGAGAGRAREGVGGGASIKVPDFTR